MGSKNLDDSSARWMMMVKFAVEMVCGWELIGCMGKEG